MHCNECYRFVYKRMQCTSKRVYTIIFALQNFKICVYDSSHLKIRDHPDAQATEHDRYSNQHSATKHTVTVNEGCFIVFDSALIHGGAPFDYCSGTCYRLHFYILPEYEQMKITRDNDIRVTFCQQCFRCNDLIKNDTLITEVLHDCKLILLCYIHMFIYTNILILKLLILCHVLYSSINFPH